MKIIQSCPHGCTKMDLVEMGIDLNKFDRWMRGQTYSMCEGKRFNHETRKYEDDECSKNPHGDIYYTDDVTRYLYNHPVID